MIGIVRSKGQESYPKKRTQRRRFNPPLDGGGRVRILPLFQHQTQKRQNIITGRGVDHIKNLNKDRSSRGRVGFDAVSAPFLRQIEGVVGPL
jgi:hypothetical protein